MSVQLNFGIGDGGFNLLRTVQGVMSVCTSDGVAGVVIRFLDAFGACVAICPHLSARIRAACIENRHTILGEIKVAVGYLRGDASAILTETSGGSSAVAFIIALTEVFENDDMMWVMREIAKDLLPATILPPSPSEMVVCLSVIHKRCPSFEFCTHYAKIVTAIRRTRAAGGASAAFDNLTSAPTPESVIPLLRNILRSSLDKYLMLYIVGDEMMGWISAAVSWWYGSDVEIVSEGLIIWPSTDSTPRYRIRVEAGAQVSWWHENKVTSLSDLLPQVLPKLCRRTPTDSLVYSPLTYPTSGFVQGALGLLGFTEEVQDNRVYILIGRLAFCLINSLDVNPEYLRGAKPRPLIEYLGPLVVSSQCINRSLQHTCGTPSIELDSSNPGTLLQELDGLVMRRISGAIPTTCTCGKCSKNGLKTWYSAGKDDCPQKVLRGFIGELILKVFLHFFVDHEYESNDFRAVIESSIPGLRVMLPVVANVWSGARQTITVNEIHECLACWLGLPWGSGDAKSVLGSSLYGLCMYIPAAFWPDMRQEGLARVRVARGAFIHRDNYYLTLIAEKIPHRARNSGGIQSQFMNVESHSSGRIFNTDYSIREMVDILRVTVTVEDALGQQRTIDLARAVQNASLSIRIEDCPHSPRSALEPHHSHRVVKTTAAAPVSGNVSVSLVCARGDYQSCMYSCDTDIQAVVMRGACVNCGIEKALGMGSGGLLIDCD